MVVKACGWNDVWLVLRDSKCASTPAPPTHTHIHIHTFPPAAAAWVVDTSQEAFMLFCCQILTLRSECWSRNRDSSDQAMLLQLSIACSWRACSRCSLTASFAAGRSRHMLRSDAAVIVRSVIWVTVFFLSAQTGLTSPLWPLHHPFIFTKRTAAS